MTLPSSLIPPNQMPSDQTRLIRQMAQRTPIDPSSRLKVSLRLRSKVLQSQNPPPSLFLVRAISKSRNLGRPATPGPLLNQAPTLRSSSGCLVRPVRLPPSRQPQSARGLRTSCQGNPPEQRARCPTTEDPGCKLGLPGPKARLAQLRI